LPDFKVSGWNGLFAPKGTPEPILDRLTDALDRTLDDDITRKRLIDRINEIPDKASRGPLPLADLVKRDVARWVRIIKAAGGGGVNESASLLHRHRQRDLIRANLKLADSDS
jgi:tripartite-type tricarboxylate transporter receptor subunit TctC